MSSASIGIPQSDKDIPGGNAQGHHGSVRSYAIGYALAILLTTAAFGMAVLPSETMTPTSVQAAICVLAVAQMLVHVIFFTHINTSPQSGTNIIALLLAIVIIMLVVIGSMWIMGHLSDHMMSMPELMRMQR